MNFYNSGVAGESSGGRLLSELRTSPLLLWKIPISFPIPISLLLLFYAGVFTGAIIRLISDIRAKHGKGSVDLRGCGKFTLAEDLSDIKDITSIDLSSINRLEGM